MILISRRRLFALAGIVAAAGAGVVSAVSTHHDAGSRPSRAPASPTPTPSTPPPELTVVLAGERALIAALSAAIAASPPQAPLLTNIRADHLAHEQAINAALGRPARTAQSPTAAPASTGIDLAASPTLTAIRVAEQRAQQAAAAASASLTGAPAVLLASICACEAGHVELLT